MPEARHGRRTDVLAGLVKVRNRWRRGHQHRPNRRGYDIEVEEGSLMILITLVTFVLGAAMGLALLYVWSRVVEPRLILSRIERDERRRHG